MAARLLLRSLRRLPLVSSSPRAADLLHRSPSLGVQSGREFWGNLHAVLLRRGFGGSHSSSPSKTPRRIGLGAVANALSASFVCASAFPPFNQTSLPHDHGSNSEKTRWTDDIITVNLMVYVADIALKRKLTMRGAKDNDLITEGQIWRLATPTLLHGGLCHIALNTLSLASIGPTVEEFAGPRRFLAIYCTSALSCSLMSYWFTSTPGIGASGAIFGLVGAYAVYIWRHKELLRNRKEVLESVKIVVLLNLGIGILLRHRIDNWAHLGGFLGGAAVEWFYGPDWKRRPLFGQ